MSAPSNDCGLPAELRQPVTEERAIGKLELFYFVLFIAMLQVLHRVKMIETMGIFECI